MTSACRPFTVVGIFFRQERPADILTSTMRADAREMVSALIKRHHARLVPLTEAEAGAVRYEGPRWPGRRCNPTTWPTWTTSWG